MPVKGGNTLTMVQDDVLAIAVAVSSEFHHRVAWGMDRGSFPIGNIQAAMKFHFFCPRGAAPSVTGAQPSRGRPLRRDGGDETLKFALERPETSFQVIHNVSTREGSPVLARQGGLDLRPQPLPTAQ